MCSPNQLLLLAIATLLYAQYSEAAKITSPQRPVVKAKAAVNDIPANTTSLDRRTLDRQHPHQYSGSGGCACRTDGGRYASARLLQRRPHQFHPVRPATHHARLHQVSINLCHDITKVSHLVIVHVLKHSSSTRTIQQLFYQGASS